jgi:hypothetical protein
MKAGCGHRCEHGCESRGLGREGDERGVQKQRSMGTCLNHRMSFSEPRP